MTLGALFLLFSTEVSYTELSVPPGAHPRLRIAANLDPLEPLKTSPRGGFTFGSLLTGQAKLSESSGWVDRFRIYTPTTELGEKFGVPAARLLLRAWNNNFKRLRFDHNPLYNRGTVDVYLCEGGVAGGEQRFDDDRSLGRAVRVNTIYIYRISDRIPPTEWVREICHEYGHASLPAVGGFSEPEDWGNGYLGEKLFMRWLTKDAHSGLATRKDLMGATAPELRSWMRANGSPHAQRIAANGLSKNSFRQVGPKAMDSYVGLYLHLESTLPDKVFSRCLELGFPKFTDVRNGIELAIDELAPFDLKSEAFGSRSTLWFPMPKSVRLENAKIVANVGPGVQLRPIDRSLPVRILPR